MGAVTGGLIGAAAGAPGLIVGATAGSLVGQAMSMPPVVRVAPSYPAYAPAPSARGTESTDQYISRWQGFMEPSRQR
jgi:hypothetical protein